MTPMPTPPEFIPYDLTALCLWREARGEGSDGIQAVANVIVNRANKHKTSCDVQVMLPKQFSSMTIIGDSQYLLFPKADDVVWAMCQDVARSAKASTLPDITQSSTMYYAPKGLGSNVSPWPILINGVERVFPRGWDRTKVVFQVAIGTQLFFTEVA